VKGEAESRADEGHSSGARTGQVAVILGVEVLQADEKEIADLVTLLHLSDCLLVRRLTGPLWHATCKRSLEHAYLGNLGVYVSYLQT